MEWYIAFFPPLELGIPPAPYSIYSHLCRSVLGGSRQCYTCVDGIPQRSKQLGSSWCDRFCQVCLFAFIGLIPLQLTYHAKLREVVQKFPNLRKSITEKLLTTMSQIKAGKVFRGTLWIVGEYVTEVNGTFFSLRCIWNNLRTCWARFPNTRYWRIHSRDPYFSRRDPHFSLRASKFISVKLLCILWLMLSAPTWCGWRRRGSRKRRGTQAKYWKASRAPRRNICHGNSIF